MATNFRTLDLNLLRVFDEVMAMTSSKTRSRFRSRVRKFVAMV